MHFFFFFSAKLTGAHTLPALLPFHSWRKRTCAPSATGDFVFCFFSFVSILNSCGLNQSPSAARRRYSKWNRRSRRSSYLRPMFTSTLVRSLSLPLEGLPLSNPVCFHSADASRAGFFFPLTSTYSSLNSLLSPDERHPWSGSQGVKQFCCSEPSVS